MAVLTTGDIAQARSVQILSKVEQVRSAPLPSLLQCIQDLCLCDCCVHCTQVEGEVGSCRWRHLHAERSACARCAGVAPRECQDVAGPRVADGVHGGQHPGPPGRVKHEAPCGGERRACMVLPWRALPPARAAAPPRHMPGDPQQSVVLRSYALVPTRTCCLDTSSAPSWACCPRGRRGRVPVCVWTSAIGAGSGCCVSGVRAGVLRNAMRWRGTRSC